MMKMKQVKFESVMELLAGLKARYTDLLEDKNMMLATCEFDCEEDEIEFDCITNELKATKKAIDDLYDVIYSEDTIIVDDMICFPVEDEFMPF